MSNVDNEKRASGFEKNATWIPKRVGIVGSATLLTVALGLSSCGGGKNANPETPQPLSSPTTPLLTFTPEVPVFTATPSSTGENNLNPFCVVSHINNRSSELDDAARLDINRQLDLAKEAGFSTMRIDFDWEQLQRDGAWDFAMYDAIVDTAKKNGIAIIAILNTNEPPPWEGDYNSTIKTPEAYAKYAREVANHFKGRVTEYELGNEDNYRMDAKTYTEYFVAGYAAVKAVDPEAKIISGGVTIDADPINWIKTMYANGAKGLDFTFGYHPYSQPEGPTTSRNFAIMQDLQRELKKEGNNNGIYATEIGWPIGNGGESVSPDIQARDIGQVYTLIRNGGYSFVRKACVYDLTGNVLLGGKPDPADRFGIYDRSKPRLAVKEIQRARSAYNTSGKNR